MFQSDLPVVPLPSTDGGTKEAFSMLKGLSLDDAITKIANSMVDFAFKLIIAILVFYIGKFIITRIYKFTRTVMTNRKMDASLTTFVLSLIRIVLYFILIITIIGILGIETSSFLALFASAGVAIGMALSGTLQNFAGGVLILLLKPYRVGDYIEAAGYSGTVKEIQIFHTVINTLDNKAIIIPNGGLSTGSINNYSLESYRRVDWSISLSYDDNYDEAAKVIKEMLLQDPRVVKQYIEDDRLERLEDETLSESELKEESAEVGEPVKKTPWYKRLFGHKNTDEENAISLRNTLIEKIRRNAAEPKKKDCAPFVGLNEMADNSINIAVRAWTHSDNYWGLYFDMNSRFFRELPQKGFHFPYPQLDVHLDKLM